MSGFGRWWWLLPVAFVAIVAKGLLLTAWVVGQVEDAVTDALGAAELEAVEFVEVDGLGLAGLTVVLEGPPADEASAVAAIEAEDAIAAVIYREFQSEASLEPMVGPPATDDPASDDRALPKPSSRKDP